MSQLDLRSPSGAVLAELVLDHPGELELPVLLRDPPLGERLADALLDLVELVEAVGQLPDDRAAEGLVVGLRLEVPAVLQRLQDHAGEVEDPVGGRLHDGLPARSSAENGCRKSCSSTTAGSAATSAPIRAASSTWIGLRASETTIWVWKP